MDFKLEVTGPGAEVAKELAGATRGALRRVFGPSLEEFGQLLGDEIRAFRFSNLLRLGAKMKKVARRHGILTASFGRLPIGDAIRTIEAASLEEDDEVQELWARLIVKAASNENERDRQIKKLYIDLLRSLSATDAALLELLFEGPQRKGFNSVKEVHDFNTKMDSLAEKKWRIFSQDERNVSVQNLIRLRVITFTPRVLQAGEVLIEAPRPRDVYFPKKMAFVDPKRFEVVLTELLERIYVASGAMNPSDTGPIQLHTESPFGPREFGAAITVPEFLYSLTPLGIDLMRAVTIAPTSRRGAEQ